MPRGTKVAAASLLLYLFKADGDDELRDKYCMVPYEIQVSKNWRELLLTTTNSLTRRVTRDTNTMAADQETTSLICVETPKRAAAGQ